MNFADQFIAAAIDEPYALSRGREVLRRNALNRRIDSQRRNAD